MLSLFQNCRIGALLCGLLTLEFAREFCAGIRPRQELDTFEAVVLGLRGNNKTCDGAFAGSKEVPKDEGGCPKECPFVAEVKLDKDSKSFCQFKCVAKDKCGTDDLVEEATIPDEEDGLCRRCDVEGCKTCAKGKPGEKNDKCEKCMFGYRMDGDGKECVNVGNIFFIAFFVALGIGCIPVLIWYLNLMGRPTVNQEGVDYALQCRSRAKLRQPSTATLNPETGEGPGLPWPLSTNPMTANCAGPGTMLMYRFQVAVLVWAVVILVVWVGLAVVCPRGSDADGTCMDVFFLGLLQTTRPEQFCAVVHWGRHRQMELIYLKVWLTAFAYVFSFMGAMWFARMGESLIQEHDNEYTTMSDYVALIEGLPDVPGEQKLEETLKEAVEKASGEKVVGVSVCWNYHHHIKEVQSAVDDMMDEEERKAAGKEAPAPRPAEAQEDGALRRLCKWVDSKVLQVWQVSDPDYLDIETDDAAEEGSVGVKTWKGHWIKGDLNGEMDLDLEVVGGQRLVGSGSDSVGTFSVEGSVTGTTIKLTKTYPTHPVEYDGTWDDGAGTYKGNYTIAGTDAVGADTGQFDMTPPSGLSPKEKKDAHATTTAHTPEQRAHHLIQHMHSSDSAFVVFDTEEGRDKALANEQALKLPTGEQLTLVSIEASSDPETVLWKEYGITSGERPGRLLKGCFCMALALIGWTVILYIPYAHYMSSFTYSNGDEPSFFAENTFVVLVFGAQFGLFVLAQRVAAFVGYRTLDMEMSVYIVVYNVALIVNLVLDVSLVSYLSYEEMVGSGVRVADGRLLGELSSLQEILESYPMQKSIGKLLFKYCWPVTFFLPYAAEPFAVIWMPWHIGCKFVGTKPGLVGERAEKCLELPKMEQARYADIMFNGILATIILFVAPGYLAPTWGAMIFSHAYIYAYDHYKMFRSFARFQSKSSECCKTAQHIFSLPCAILAAALVFKANQMSGGVDAKLGSGYLKGNQLWMGCLAALGGHLLLHRIMLNVVIPGTVNVPDIKTKLSYAEGAKLTPASWFSCNPVHCLRSKYLYKHEPAQVYFMVGEEHLQKVNPAIGAHFSEAPPAKSTEWD